MKGRPAPTQASDWPEITAFSNDLRPLLQAMYEVIDANNLWPDFKTKARSQIANRFNLFNAGDKKIVATLNEKMDVSDLAEEESTIGAALAIMRRVAWTGFDEVHKQETLKIRAGWYRNQDCTTPPLEQYLPTLSKSKN